jgi:hypothetical protein
MSEKDQNLLFDVGPRLTQKRELVPKCDHCSSPGVYHNHESIKQGWPGCYDPFRYQQPVGLVCPNCNMLRPDNVSLGETINYEWPLLQRIIVRLWRFLFPLPFNPNEGR